VSVRVTVPVGAMFPDTGETGCPATVTMIRGANPGGDHLREPSWRRWRSFDQEDGLAQPGRERQPADVNVGPRTRIGDREDHQPEKVGVLHHVGQTTVLSSVQRQEAAGRLLPYDRGKSFGEGRMLGANRWKERRDLEWQSVLLRSSARLPSCTSRVVGSAMRPGC